MHPHRIRIPLLLFGLGVVLTILALQLPAARALFGAVERSGYPGAFLGGMLYAFAFTSGAATVVLANLREGLNPLLVALLGGVGASLYDFTVFSMVRNGVRRGGFIDRFRKRLDGKRPLTWGWFALGFVVLASPLPDEIAAGMMGAVHQRPAAFLATSFLANALGILTIVSVL